MAAPRTLTAANSVFALAIPGLFPSPVVLDGYAADNAFGADSVPTAEAHIGVDGRMSAGFIFALTKMKVHLEADSFSVDIFDAWSNAQKSERDLYFAYATIDLPSIGKSFTLTKGALTNYKNFPDAKKILGAVEFEITWESISQNLV